MMKKSNWYPFLKEYNSCYLATDGNGISYYFDKQGALLTRTYRPPAPNSLSLLSSLRYTSDSILHTYSVEFTTEGIVYGVGKCQQSPIINIEFDYFFVPYEVD